MQHGERGEANNPVAPDAVRTEAQGRRVAQRPPGITGSWGRAETDGTEAIGWHRAVGWHSAVGWHRAVWGQRPLAQRPQGGTGPSGGTCRRVG